MRRKIFKKLKIQNKLARTYSVVNIDWLQ